MLAQTLPHLIAAAGAMLAAAVLWRELRRVPSLLRQLVAKEDE